MNSERFSEFEAYKSNEVPPEDTQNRIRNLLSCLKSDVESLACEISTMRNAGRIPSKELLADCAKKTEEMEVLRGAISPLKMIPREILCEIFLYANNLDFPLTIPPQRLTTFPWILIQVCSLWRDTTFGMPHVWENIEIRNDVKDAQIPVIINIFRTILTRGAAQISLVTPHSDQLFTNLVVPNLTRLKRLETTISHNSFRTFLESLGGFGDSLISIKLRFVENALPDFGGISSQTSPNIRNVTLINNPPDREWLHGSQFLPWARLTDIALPNSYIPIPTLHTILGQCVCLRNATLLIGGTAPPGLSGEEVLVPNLEYLLLHRHGINPDWEAFLRPLILPSFHSIIVNGARYWSQAAFTSLVVRSACPLELLHLLCYRDTTHDLYSLLKHVPTLRRLILPWLLIPASVFEAIRQRGTLPVLMHLECTVDPLGLDAFLDLVESSGQPGAGASSGGIRFGSLIRSKERGFGDAYKRYLSLRPKFLDDGRNIRVVTPRY